MSVVSVDILARNMKSDCRLAENVLVDQTLARDSSMDCRLAENIEADQHLARNVGE